MFRNKFIQDFIWDFKQKKIFTCCNWLEDVALIDSR